MNKKKPGAGSPLAYTADRQRSDRNKTQSLYGARMDKLVKADKADPFAYLAGDQKTKDKMDKAHMDAGSAIGDYKANVADQNRWVARGAKANALATMKLKKKPMGKDLKKKIYGGE